VLFLVDKYKHNYELPLKVYYPLRNRSFQTFKFNCEGKFPDFPLIPQSKVNSDKNVKRTEMKNSHPKTLNTHFAICCTLYIHSCS